MVTALHPNKKERRKKTKEKKRTAYHLKRVRRRMETWLLEYQTCMMPLCFFLIYYSSSCCCKNLVRDESKAEAQTLPFWCVLLLLFVIQWLVTPYFFPHSFITVFFTPFSLQPKTPHLVRKACCSSAIFPIM